MIQSKKLFIRCFNMWTLCSWKSKGKTNLYSKEMCLTWSASGSSQVKSIVNILEEYSVIPSCIFPRDFALGEGAVII